MSVIFQSAAAMWSQMKLDFDAHVEHAYAQAEHAYAQAEFATKGCMVTAEGRAHGITGYELMTGPSARAYRWATEELKDHWDATPRPDLTQFELDWFTTRGGL